VGRSAKVVARIVADLGDKTVADLTAENPEDPYEVLTAPFPAFERRAQELQCDSGELRRLACDAYSGIRAGGPVAEEFLAEFVQDCR
jgi:hypothetical protein